MNAKKITQSAAVILFAFGVLPAGSMSIQASTNRAACLKAAAKELKAMNNACQRKTGGAKRACFNSANEKHNNAVKACPQS